MLSRPLGRLAPWGNRLWMACGFASLQATESHRGSDAAARRATRKRKRKLDHNNTAAGIAILLRAPAGERLGELPVAGHEVPSWHRWKIAFRPGLFLWTRAASGIGEGTAPEAGSARR